MIGDLREVLKLLLVKIPEKRHDEWVQHIQDMKEKYPLNYDHSQLTGPYVIQKLYELTDVGTTITLPAASVVSPFLALRISMIAFISVPPY